MPKPRLPAAKAEVSGAALINAGRFADRKAPKRTRALGEPYKMMSEAEQAAWHEFADELPWLNSSHRALLHLEFDSMMVDGQSTPLTPGMSVTAEIKTRRKRVIEYFLDPFRKYQSEGLRER